MDEIDSLETMPERYSLYEEEPWRSKGLRNLIVDNYLIFYFTDKSKRDVVIVSIMYGGRDVSQLL